MLKIAAKETIIGTVILGIILIGLLSGYLLCSKGALTRVLPPAPVLVSSNTDSAKSGLLDYCLTIWAEVRNDGGAGDVVIEITYSEAGQSWTKSVRQNFQPNETKKISMDFQEATLGGSGEYKISAR